MNIRKATLDTILRSGRASGHPPFFFAYFKRYRRVTTPVRRTHPPCFSRYFNGHLQVTTLLPVWLAAALLGNVGLASAADWSTVTTPAPGPAQSIGFYTAGCLQGAQPL